MSGNGKGKNSHGESDLDKEPEKESVHESEPEHESEKVKGKKGKTGEEENKKKPTSESSSTLESESSNAGDISSQSGDSRPIKKKGLSDQVLLQMQRRKRLKELDKLIAQGKKLKKQVPKTKSKNKFSLPRSDDDKRKKKKHKSKHHKSKHEKKHSKTKDSKKGASGKTRQQLEWSDSEDDDVDLGVLRADKKLKSLAIGHLKKLGLVSDYSGSSDISSSSSTESETYDSDSDDSEYRGQACAKKNSKKSGMVSKPTDRVRYPQIWAQSALHFDLGSPCKFEDLNFNKLVAGELEIITSPKITKAERSGRLRLLKKLAIHAESFDISIIRSIYSGVLRQIELGLLDWTSDFANAEQLAITKSLSTKSVKKGKVKNADQSDSSKLIWFCHNYNKDKCSHKSDHTGMVKGKNRFLRHICAVCYLKDKIELKHPETSSACPHYKE